MSEGCDEYDAALARLISCIEVHRRAHADEQQGVLTWREARQVTYNDIVRAWAEVRKMAGIETMPAQSEPAPPRYARVMSSDEMDSRIEHLPPLPPPSPKRFDPSKGEYIDESETIDPTWLA